MTFGPRCLRAQRKDVAVQRLLTVAALTGAAVMALSGAGSIAGAQDQQPGADDRLTPTSITYKVSPGRDRRAPYRFRVRGRVNVPPGLVCPPGQSSGGYCTPLPRERACENGRVAVRYKSGRSFKKTISLRRAKTQPDGSGNQPPFCTFSSSVSFSVKSRLRPGRLKVQVQFLGNAFYKAKRGPTKFVRLGNVNKKRR